MTLQWVCDRCDMIAVVVPPVDDAPTGWNEDPRGDFCPQCVAVELVEHQEKVAADLVADGYFA